LIRFRSTRKGWSIGALSLACMVGLAGCWSLNRRPVNPARFAPPCRLETYENGRPQGERTVPPGSSDELAITTWLHVHKSGWHLDFNTYAPGRLVKGDGFNLNLSGRVCVLNYDPDGQGDWVQVSRTLEESDALPAPFALGH
jgi:hypothetical protein